MNNLVASRRLVYLISSLALWCAVLCFGFNTFAQNKTKRVSVARLPSALTLRVMTYNIHVGIGSDAKLDLARIARVINDARPDLVGLQEVDRGVERTNRVDQIAELARMTNMEYAFAPNLDYQGGKYGVAILSRLPILHREHRLFHNLHGSERRGSLRVEVEANKKRLSFVTTHLDYQNADGRLYESAQLLQPLRALQMPVIISGDFNEEPGAPAYQAMLIEYFDGWQQDVKREEKGLTFSALKPTKRIDYIFYARTSEGIITNAKVINTQASDHLPLIIDMGLK